MEEVRSILLKREEVRRIISRLAYEIAEKCSTSDELTLIGIRTRGAHLVRRIALKIESFNHRMPSVEVVDVSPYRDDRRHKESNDFSFTDQFQSSLDDKVVVLVDDVIYTGRTIRAALEMISHWGKPEKIMVAVLVDRGDRELPIRADIVGKNVQISKSERVNVYLEESDGIDQVTVNPKKRKPSYI